MLVFVHVLVDLFFHMLCWVRERDYSYVTGVVCWDQSWGNCSFLMDPTSYFSIAYQLVTRLLNGGGIVLVDRDIEECDHLFC